MNSENQTEAVNPEPKPADDWASYLDEMEGGAPKIIVYGLPGVGKSTFANTTPSPVFLQFEDGLRRIKCKKSPLIKTWESVMDEFKRLASKEHPFRTVVLDTLDSLEKIIHNRVAKDNRKDSIAEIGYNKGYDYALEYWEKVTRACDILNTEKNMMILMLAHSEEQKVNPPDNEPYTRYSMAIHKEAYKYLYGWSEAVLFAKQKEYVTKTEGDFGRAIVKAVGTEERFLFTNNRPAYCAKNRFGLPLEIPFKWEEISKAVNFK